MDGVEHYTCVQRGGRVSVVQKVGSLYGMVIYVGAKRAKKSQKKLSVTTFPLSGQSSVPSSSFVWLSFRNVYE